MPFSVSPFARSRAPRPERVQSTEPSHVFGIGSHAFVANQTGDVSLDDGNGGASVATLADGVEVEIIAWRPRRAATLYHVRATESRVEGWLCVTSLRRTREPAESMPVAAVSRKKR